MQFYLLVLASYNTSKKLQISQYPVPVYKTVLTVRMVCGCVRGWWHKSTYKKQVLVLRFVPKPFSFSTNVFEQNLQKIICYYGV